jgi:hypothetical protein
MSPTWALWSACVLPPEGRDRPEGPEVYLERGQTTRVTDEDGRVGIEFRVPKDAVSLQITGTSD